MLRAKTCALVFVALLVSMSVPTSAFEKEPLSEYAGRRARVAAEIKGNVLILYGNLDSDLVKFKQDDNFFYLTGFNEPDAVLLIDATGDVVEETLFIKARNPADERWTGATMSAGADGQRITGIKSVEVVAELSGAIARVLQKKPKLYTLTS